MADYIVKSKVKEYVSGKNMRTAEDALDGLDAVVKYKLDKAIERANANGRKTLKGYDF